MHAKVVLLGTELLKEIKVYYTFGVGGEKHIHHSSTSVEAREQLVGVGSLSPSCGFRGLILGHSAEPG